MYDKRIFFIICKTSLVKKCQLGVNQKRKLKAHTIILMVMHFNFTMHLLSSNLAKILLFIIFDRVEIFAKEI